ncbi:hypothetical protein ColKHC_07088 [Colletotrichum higginsianum]|nr:hypothetical protein ColKHC_07088 [Colletotrichum higginsianum]
MQFANILLAALAGAASVSARTNPTARRQAGAAAHPGCRIVPASDLNFGVADLTSGTVVTKVLTFPLVGAFARGFPIDQGGGALARLDVEDDVVVRDTLQVINSFQCAESLSFEFEVANDAGVEEDINVTFTASALGGFFVQVGDQCN